MDPSVELGQAIDASVAFGIVVVFQAAYCGLKSLGALHVEDRTRLWALTIVGCALGFFGLVSMILFFVFREHTDLQTAAYATMATCKGTSVLSVWCFEVLDVLHPSRHSWLRQFRAPFSDWGSLVFGAGLAAQCVFAVLGFWQLAAYQVEILWAVPLTSHINIAAITTYGLIVGRHNGAVEKRLLWVWVAASVCASVASVALLVGSALGRVPEQAAAQCTVCVGILLVKAFRDRCMAKRHEQGLPQDGPADASSAPGTDLQLGEGHAELSRQYLPSRADSGIALMPSVSSFTSSTTVCSEMYRYYETDGMQFPKCEFSVFRIDGEMKTHANTIHWFYTDINDGKLVPELVDDSRNILDVGTGTGSWARDVASARQEAMVIGTDLAPIQPSCPPANLWFYIDNANGSTWTWDERFDFIHMRGMDGGIKDWHVSLQAAFRCQSPGGFIELSDMTFHPVGPVASDSIWGEWQRMLDVLRDATGFSFGIHEDGRALRELQNVGYEPVGSSCRSYQLKRGTHVYGGHCLLQGVIEQMKGILTRSFEFIPHSIARCELVRKLEEELLLQGITIEVHTSVAKRSASGARATSKAVVGMR